MLHWLTSLVRGRQLHDWKCAFPTGFLQERHRCYCGLHLRLCFCIGSGNCFDDRLCHGHCFWLGHHDGHSRCFERRREIRGCLDQVTVRRRALVLVEHGDLGGCDGCFNVLICDISRITLLALLWLKGSLWTPSARLSWSL